MCIAREREREKVLSAVDRAVGRKCVPSVDVASSTAVAFRFRWP